MLRPADFRHIVIFTGAGISVESGVPTYRGSGGTWREYRWQEYACEEAFERAPAQVLDFHARRRRAVADCEPNAGHAAIAALARRHDAVTVITQNIDGLHGRAGNEGVLELHGSLWRVRCPCQAEREDPDPDFIRRRCAECGEWLRPAVTWFGDALDQAVFKAAARAVNDCDLFIAVGTSGVVWPAAGLQEAALEGQACCVEVNPEPTGFSARFDEVLRAPAAAALPGLLDIAG